VALTAHASAARAAAFDRRPLIALCLGWFVVIIDATIFIAAAVGVPSLTGGVRLAAVVAGAACLGGLGLALSYPHGKLRP